MSLIRWYKLDGNTYDSSSTRDNGTNTGVTFSSSYGKIGQGGNFTGDGNTEINFTEITLTTHHTVCFWMYSNTASPGGATDSMILGSYGDDTYDWMYAADSLRFRINDGTSSYSWDTTTPGAEFPVNYYHVWHHVSVIFSSSTMELFIDGTSYGTRSYDGTFVLSNIGHPYNSTSFDYTGYLNDVRVYDHVLSTREIKELARCKVLHWKFVENKDTSGDLVLDSSNFGRNATLNSSTPTWTADTVVGAGCYYWASGSNDYIQISSTDFPVVFTDEISISLWYYPQNTGGAWESLVHGTISGGWGTSYWLAKYSSTSARFALNGTSYNFNPGFTQDTWHHIFATYDGSNVNCFIDGIEKIGNTARTGSTTNQSGLKLGLTGDGSYAMYGKIADLKIYNKGYSQTEGETMADFLRQTACQLDNKGNLWC